MVPRQRISQPQQELPPASSKEQQQPLLLSEDTDNDSSTSLASSSFSSEERPTSKDSAAAARMHHDYFNLVALLFVIGTTVVDWDVAKLVEGGDPLQAWKGQYFYLNWMTTFVYFFADLVWVAVVPSCVKSPSVIIKHHIMAMLYLFGPLHWSEFRCFMGACLSVEINTWLLIMRRILFKKSQSLTTQWNQSLRTAVSVSFYISWIVIRCLVYPAVMYQYVKLAQAAFAETNQWFHWPMIVMPVHFALCILNIKWTYDLFRPMVKNWLVGGHNNKSTTTTVASGL